MGQWKDERESILADDKLDPKIREALEHAILADPTFFDIDRLRPYFTWDKTSYAPRLRITYVTACSNCRSPIQAARVHGSIIKHLQEKLKTAAQFAAFQDQISSPGTVTDTHVSFEVILAFRFGTSAFAPAHYKPDPTTSARRWRGIFGDRDPYKTSDTASTTPSAAITDGDKITVTPTTTEAIAAATVEIPKETGDHPAYLSSLRDALRTKLGTQEAAAAAEHADTLINGVIESATISNSAAVGNEDLTAIAGVTIGSLMETSMSKESTLKHLKQIAECNDEHKNPDDTAPCLLSVYGSLRKGMHNHFCLESPDLVFIGKGTARGLLFPVGNAVPGAHFSVDTPPDKKVTVETYLLPFKMLRKLDKLLGASIEDPTSLYARHTALTTLDSGELLLTHVYEYNSRTTRDPIPSGDWLEYRKSRE